MKNIFNLSLLSLTVLFSNAAISQDKIVGGELVDPAKTETRYIVSIGGGCAGSIIDAKWILTAAHCKSIFTRAITGGNVDLNASGRVKLEIKKSYIHPKNNASKYSYDFALLELKNPINFEATGLTKISMTDPEMIKTGAIDEGVVATVLGWGTTSENGSISTLLRMVEVPIVSNARANAPGSYNGQIDDTMIAAGYDQGKKDSCQGDSGGPLTITGTDGQPVLAGVVSWGRGCARAKYYGVYGNVAVAHPWIIQTMSASK